MASPVKVQIEGMHCASCTARVERVLGIINGVENVVVNLSTETASFVAESTELPAVEKAIEGAGFRVVQTDQKISIVERRLQDSKAWLRRIIIGSVCAAPVIFLHWSNVRLSIALPVSAFFAALALIFAGRAFFAGAWNALKGKSANMDTLVVLGASLAFLFSLVETARFFIEQRIPGGIFFDATVMIIALISVGKYLEARAKLQAARAFESLNLSNTGEVERFSAEQWQKVDVRRVETGDKLRVPTGQTIPVDGTINSGACQVDESLLTGESVPVHKEEGDEVSAGSLVLNGMAFFKATEVGHDTTTAKIQESVEKLQDQKADIQRKLVDKISAVFVPIMIVLGVVTFIVWFLNGATFAESIEPAIAVLVVACPCALGLATPVAIMVGTSRAAQRGILVQDISAFERSRKLKTIAFDKTGTLTDRKLIVDASRSSSVAIKFGAAIERGTSHPIADAIISFASDNEISVPDATNFQTLPGEGASALIAGERYHIRSAENAESSDGAVHVAVFKNGEEIGQITLRTTIRPEARDVIASLQNNAVDVWMISGDSFEAAQFVAAELGIKSEHVKAEVSPGGKSALIESFSKRPIAMVGDGINDAPALAASDIGIAMGGGSDFAKVASAIAIIGDSLWLVSDAIEIAQNTFKTIIQNLVWAFAYNLVLVPVAALGYLTPAMASAAMALSSVSVVLNSLRIKVPPTRVG